MHLRLTHQHLEQLATLAQNANEEEICGLLFGTNHTVAQIIPIQNKHTQPKQAFKMDEQALFQAFKQAEKEELSLVGIYHSHPHSAPIPSPEDIREAELNYPQVAHLIIRPLPNNAEFKAWHIQKASVIPIPLLIGNEALLEEPHNPLTSVQKTAILITSIVALILLVVVSFSLLPPAPPIPMPLN
jgi:[CysO sulfur-carrier protein]-S-L-cysteine hydrolase